MQHLSKSAPKRRGISLSNQHRHDTEKQRQIINIPSFHNHSRVVRPPAYTPQPHLHKFTNVIFPRPPTTIYHNPKVQFTYRQPSQPSRENYVHQSQTLNQQINSMQKQIEAKSKLLHTIKQSRSAIKYLEQTPVNHERVSRNRVQDYQNLKIQSIFNNINIPNITQIKKQNQSKTILNEIKQQSNLQSKNLLLSKDNNLCVPQLKTSKNNNVKNQKKVKLNDENTPKTSEASQQKKKERKTIDPQRLKLMQSKLLDIIRACQKTL